MLYEVITDYIGFKGLEALEQFLSQQESIQSNIQPLIEGNHERNKEVRDISQEKDRITSYNVCYTKLLRFTKLNIHRFF